MSTDIFSRTACDRTAPIYAVIRHMPFNAELAAGGLSEARFKHYITQDAHYLIGFGRALTLAAAKAPNPDRIVQFAKSAEGAIVVERALHGSFFARYGITAETRAVEVFNQQAGGLVNAPTPPGGEGCWEVQKQEWVRGLALPLTQRSFLKLMRCPLPQEGRGRINKRPRSRVSARRQPRQQP